MIEQARPSPFATAPSQPPAESTRSPLLLAALAVIVMLVVLEVGSYVIILLSPRLFSEPIRRKAAIYAEQRAWIHRIADSSTGQVKLDSVVGWTYRAGFHGPRDTINAQGLRSDREYGAQSADSVLRVAAFGDSFVYSNEVGNDNAWAAQVEHLQPRIELLNYGVGGYGDDQAYLRFLAVGRGLAPKIAIIGFVTDDLRRTVNVYRRFVSNLEVPLFKPRYALNNGSLVLLPNPTPNLRSYLRFANDPASVRTVGANDQWYEPLVYADPLYDYSATVRVVSFLWNRVYRRYLDPQRIWRGPTMRPESNAFRIQSEIFSRFVRAADSLGIEPLVLFFPDHDSVDRARRGQPTLYANLVAEVVRRGLPCIDAVGAFKAVPGNPSVGAWFAAGGHYSPRGNEIVASWLARDLMAASRVTDRMPGHGLAIPAADRCGSPTG